MCALKSNEIETEKLAEFQKEISEEVTFYESLLVDIWITF